MAKIDERGLPCNLSAERFVLGAILLQGNEALAGCETALQSDDFTTEAHRRIYAAMRRMDAESRVIDHATITNELNRSSELEAVGGVSYLAELDTGLPNVANLSSYIEIIREMSSLRRIIYTCQNTIDQALSGENTTDLIASADSMLSRISQRDGQQANWQTPGQVIENHPGGLQAILSPAKYASGIQTPWDGVNYLMCGMNPGELILLAGRPSHGKSAAALQIAYGAAAQGKSIAYFSLEMNKPALIRRMICLTSRIDMNRMKHGVMNAEERQRAREASTRISQMPIFIEERMGHNMPVLRMGLRKLNAQMKIDLVIIDHFHKLQRIGNEDLREHYNRCADDLHRYSKEFECPFLVLAQLNRKCEEENRPPGNSDLAETAKLEQNADIVMFTHRPELYARNRQKEELRGVADFIIGKQRDGQVGNVEMVFLGNEQRFEERSR